MELREQMLATEISADEAAIWYLGQETFLIKKSGKYLLFDPYLSYYVDRVCSDNEITWIRRYPVPIEPQELDFVDYVFISHDHEDHCDPDTLTPLAKINRKAIYVIPPCASDSLAKCGIDNKFIMFADEINTLHIDNIIIKAIPAAHEVLHKDCDGNYRELGYYVSIDGMTFFHSGDMCPYDEIGDYLTRCDIAMIAVNGRDPYRLSHGIEGNFNASEAIDLAKAMNASILFPMHFDLYDVNSIPYGELADTMEREQKFIPSHVFMPGERFIFKK